MQSPAITLEVASRFQALRRRYVAIHVIQATAWCCALALAVIVCIAACDYVWEWSLTVRRNLVTIAGIFIATCWFLMIVRIVTASERRRFVGQLESRFDSMGQRLRTVLDVVEGRLLAPEPMLTALGNQTLGRWETSAPAQIIPIARMLAALLAMLALALAMGLLPVMDTDWSKAIQRAIGQDRSYTSVQVTPGNVRVVEGVPISVALEMKGRIQGDVTLYYRNDKESDWIENRLVCETNLDTNSSQFTGDRQAQFRASLGKATTAMEYRFETRTGSTDKFVIEVQPLIRVESVEVEVIPPAYTQLGTRSFYSEEVTALQGSDVKVHVVTNHPLVRGWVELEGADTKLEAIPEGDGNGKSWNLTLPTDQSLRWRFHGVGAEDVPLIAWKGRLRIRVDEPPRIEFRDPPEQVKVHTLAELPMRVQLTDDFGIMEAGIAFQLADDEFELVHWNYPSASGETATSLITQLRLEQVLPLESFGLSERDFVSYYAYVVDNRPEGPNRVETETRYIDIRPLRQFFSEPNLPGGESSGRTITQLDEILTRQRFLINRTRREVRSPGNEPAGQLAKIERMVASQSELADLTRFLNAFLVSIGNDDNQALAQAEAAMLQAVDALTTGDFRAALTKEEEAGRSLAEARNTVELAVSKRMSASQQRSLNQFVMQMQQRLRKTPPKTDQQLADTLEQIANDQASMAESLSSIATKVSAATGSNATASTEISGQDSTDGTVFEGPPSPSQSTTSQSSESESSNDPDAAAGMESSFLARQQELSDRLRTAQNGLSPGIKDTELVDRRFRGLLEKMDTTLGELREMKEPKRIGEQMIDTASGVRELAAHVEALARTEPALRVAALRDLTASIASMQEQAVTQLAKEPLMSSANVRPAMKDSVNAGAQSESATSDPSSAKMSTSLRALLARIQARTETLGDVFKPQSTRGDLRAAELEEQLNRFAEDRSVPKLLEETRQTVAKREQDDFETKEAKEASLLTLQQETALQANEYTDIAMQLDGLYRQMVTPQLDRLRRAESLANRVAIAMGNATNNLQAEGMNGGATPVDASQESKGKGRGTDGASQGGNARELLAMVAELKRGLAEAELSELAEKLEGNDEGQSAEIETGNSGTTGGDLFLSGGGGAKVGSMNQFNTMWSRRIKSVQQEIHERIQELVLLEIASDRDVPSPPQYRSLVDGYFKSIADDAGTLPSHEGAN